MTVSYQKLRLKGSLTIIFISVIIFRYIFALLFGAGVRVRHKLFDWKILKSQSFDVPTIVIGNLKVGGTGKTPMADMLISELKGNHRVALLSRGYGRKTKGFILASNKSTGVEIGDEAMMLYCKHPDITVAVCEKRSVGIKRIMELNPSINLIILDDAFQHRYVTATMSILLTEYDRPYYSDYLLPYGRLRDIRSQARRASIIVVTKSPENATPKDLRGMVTNINPLDYQSIFFSKMVQGELQPLFDRGYEETIKQPLSSDNVVLVSGIANPKHLITHIEKRYNIISTHIFRDHYNYKQSDITKLLNIAIENNAYIITTDKDAAKIIALDVPASEKYRFYSTPVKVEFIDISNNENKALFINNINKQIDLKNGDDN